MRFEKKVISDLNKCYAISDLTFEGKHCFLVAAEKDDPCYLFSEDGTKLETVWEKPGGVMTMVPVPGAERPPLSARAPVQTPVRERVPARPASSDAKFAEPPETSEDSSAPFPVAGSAGSPPASGNPTAAAASCQAAAAV